MDTDIRIHTFYHLCNSSGTVFVVKQTKTKNGNSSFSSSSRALCLLLSCKRQWSHLLCLAMCSFFLFVQVSRSKWHEFSFFFFFLRSSSSLAAAADNEQICSQKTGGCAIEASRISHFDSCVRAEWFLLLLLRVRVDSGRGRHLLALMMLIRNGLTSGIVEVTHLNWFFLFSLSFSRSHAFEQPPMVKKNERTRREMSPQMDRSSCCECKWVIDICHISKFYLNEIEKKILSLAIFSFSW